MSSQRKESTIIVAGGKGLRAGGDLPKQFQPIGGIPMLMHTISGISSLQSTNENRGGVAG